MSHDPCVGLIGFGENMTDAEFMLSYVARERSLPHWCGVCRRHVEDDHCAKTRHAIVWRPTLEHQLPTLNALEALANINCQQVLIGYSPVDFCTCKRCEALRAFRAEMEGSV